MSQQSLQREVCFLKEEIAQIDQQLDDLVRRETDLRRAVELLRTIPGLDGSFR